ncbi:MAG: hypothetical protein F4W90_07595 [Gammaproteobacteria bacterium]|nr:hypothetical protein [Gammaproteobacteria bacterium]
MSEKVGLGLSTVSEPTFASYFFGVNARTIERLRVGEQIWLCGDRAVGKSHVMHALASEVANSILFHGQLPQEMSTFDNQLVLFDDIDAMCGDERQEYALFAAYEAADFTSTRWIVSSRGSPQETTFRYPDVASRMGQFELLELLPVPESERGALLRFWANDREFEMPQEVTSFLLDRIPRTQASLWETLLQLEQATLLATRPLTIPFVREVLGFDAA